MSDDRLNEAKDCPFCGKRDRLFIRPYTADDGGGPFDWGFTVQCSARGIEGQNLGCGSSSGWGETEADAVAAWNRRAYLDRSSSNEAVAVKVKHRIVLEALPANDEKDSAVAEGYFGPTGESVQMNQYLYCRTTAERAWTYSADEAFRIVGEMLEKGYPARCEPPVTRTR
jgi:hypothetical protein